MLSIPSTFLLLTALDLTFSVAALPLNSTTLVGRAPAACTASTEPCVCSKTFGLRRSSLNCPGTTFKFKNPNDPTDGTVEQVSSNLGVAGTQCDHIVELQFIASEIPDSSALCTTFKANPTQYEQFFNFINSGNNLVDIPGTSNNAKGQLFKGNTLSTTTSKAASGLVSYLEQAKANGNTYPGTGVAQSISDNLDTIVGQGKGFTAGFQARYNTAVNGVIARAKQLIPTLPPFVAPGTPAGTVFCNLGPQDFTRKRSTVWGRMNDWVLERRILGLGSGSKTSTAASATSSCVPPPSSPTATKVATTSVAQPVKTPVVPPQPAPPKATQPAAPKATLPITPPVKATPPAPPKTTLPAKAPVKVTQPPAKLPAGLPVKKPVKKPVKAKKL